MSPDHIEPQFIDDERGGVTTSYGPFMLKSAFQPIFSQSANGQLTIEAFEGLIRPLRGGSPVSPYQFFQAVETKDALFIDRLCRELHLRNMARIRRKSARLFINYNPALYVGNVDMDRDVARLIKLCDMAGLSPTRIVCEITEQDSDEVMLMRMVEKLRGGLFRIAVDDYGAEESDLERVDRLKPDVIKFDAAWIARYTETSAGRLVLRQIVQHFAARGISTLFEGLEEESQISFCREIKVDLLQGFALARPEIAPTTFEERFPERPKPISGHAGEPMPSPSEAAIRRPSPTPYPDDTQPRPGRRTVPFGRRGR
jgi:EAL domain-containing protein (putative c-di-GMP-specific phosphodiesterase class I)